MIRLTYINKIIMYRMEISLKLYASILFLKDFLVCFLYALDKTKLFKYQIWLLFYYVLKKRIINLNVPNFFEITVYGLS